MRRANVSEIVIKRLSLTIDENRYSQLFRSSIFIDFRYQSINYYRLQSILSIIEFHRLGTPGIIYTLTGHVAGST